MTVSELLPHVTAQLKNAGVENARFEARMLIAHIMGMDSATLSPVSASAASKEQQDHLQTLVHRRASGEPIQYLLGVWEFMGLPFYVEKGALIPRADTEVLCEKALRLIRDRGYRTVLDLCCGTGCIGISLAKIGGVSVTLADISDDCLHLSQRNADLNGVSVTTVKTDLFSALHDQKFDLICCNPPYLTKEDMEHLQREVRHEPSLALYGGTDGLAFYRRISAEYCSHLNPKGAILLEIGYTQAADVASLFSTETVWKDYAGNPRVVFAEAK